ncbi:XRE family transcriptional regulator [Candidatus Magnetaquicoccus inordinatus]|uniref:XRE family transcriptional regulator n=1 Tax=Candidatus Magnetaquicoccus inordinatus TaxID=2496818 RepID=UPI00102B7B56
MAKRYSELRSGMSAAAQEQAERLAQELLAEMPLHELRQARGLSQRELAEKLQVQQPSIAKLERRTDMYLSTLRNHIAAMGGELEIIAHFPNGTVRISNFADLERNTPPKTP